ncbi:hypothetical protein V3N95_00730 [Micrococcaceae bacterium Sec6.3]
MAKRLAWTWEETVLAGWAAARNEWRGVNMRSPIVLELSEILQSLPIHPAADRRGDFRSVGSVGRKINSLRSARPDYEGVGLRVTAMEADVTERFLADQRAMLQEAARILQTYGHPSSEG